ncbi:MAG TPA: four-helix bundle copper-binding protein [Chroococcales cyanobacterium]
MLKNKFGALLVSALAINALSSYAAFGQTTEQITEDNCKQCAEVCTTTLDYCTKKGGHYADATVTNALKDCISACKSTHDFVSRGSKLQSRLAALCVAACNACAKSCESFKTDVTLRACADECRKCGGNCNKIASSGNGQ